MKTFLPLHALLSQSSFYCSKVGFSLLEKHFILYDPRISCTQFQFLFYSWYFALIDFVPRINYKTSKSSPVLNETVFLKKIIFYIYFEIIFIH